MTGESNLRWQKAKEWFIHVLSCCPDEEEDDRPALQISAPTNFRREDITIEGLSEEQQRFIREKAISDAHKMFAHLQPLNSSPSGHFASPDNSGAKRQLSITEEQFTTPRPAPTPQPTRLDRVKAHSRKISDSFKKPLGYASAGYSPVTNGFGSHRDRDREAREGSPYEMRSLMDPSQVHVASAPKRISGESISVVGSEEGGVYADRDSGKGMMRL